jgi:hypothetical protein
MSSTRPAQVELVADGDMRFADEERALLHVRLRAVTFLLSAGLALVLVRDLIFGRGPAWSTWPSRLHSATVARSRAARYSGTCGRSSPSCSNPGSSRRRGGSSRRLRLRDSVKATALVPPSPATFRSSSLVKILATTRRSRGINAASVWKNLRLRVVCAGLPHGMVAFGVVG